VLAFLQLLTASMFIAGMAFLVVLFGFVVLASIAYAAYEVRRGCESGARVVGGPAATEALGRRLATLGTALAVGVLAGGLLLFFILPRVQRAGPFPGIRADQTVGFSNEVNLGLTGSLTTDPTPVFRVESLDNQAVGRLLWRGLALYEFDGVRWSAGRPRARTITPSSGAYAMTGHERRADEGRRRRYRVQLEPLPTDALFVAGLPEQVIGSFPTLLITDGDVLRAPETAHRSVRYEATTWLVDRSKLHPTDVVELFSDQFRSMYLELPETDPRIVDLALEVVGGEGAPLEQARRLEEYLRAAYGYTLELPRTRADDPLARFLFERREGHCEYFASSMAVMLRLLDIPSRIVNGFAGGRANPLTGLQVLRAADAHSWVEAYIPGYGWLAFDPTPLAPEPVGGVWTSGLWLYWDALQSAWLDWVVDYDAEQQVTLAQALQDSTVEAATDAASSWDRLRAAWAALESAVDGLLPRALGAAAPLAALALVGLAGWGLWRLRPWALGLLRRRRMERGAADANDCRYYLRRALRALERRGFRRKPSQTAEEWATSVTDPALRAAAVAVVGVYQAARFGGDPRAERELPELVRALERG